MKKIILVSIFCILSICFNQDAYALLITFDDVGSTLEDEPIFNGYKGFQWDNFDYIHKDFRPVSGYHNGVVSGDYLGFNGLGQPASMSGQLFDFQGAFLTGAWNNGLFVNVRGYSGPNLIYDQTVTVNSNAPTWFLFQYNNIDKLNFNSFGGFNAGYGFSGSHFAIDDIQYGLRSTIPEPSTFILFGSTLLGSLFTKKRNFKIFIRIPNWCVNR